MLALMWSAVIVPKIEINFKKYFPASKTKLFLTKIFLYLFLVSDQLSGLLEDKEWGILDSVTEEGNLLHCNY